MLSSIDERGESLNKMTKLFCFIAAAVTADLCVDYEIGTKCVDLCDTTKSECYFDCEGDVRCEYDCAVALDQCIQKCPCFSECEAGCDGCANEICTCAYPEDNPNHTTCVDAVETAYMGCLQSCTAGDVHCLSVCGVNFNNNLHECPCNDGCPEGCPCPVYECGAFLLLD